MVADYERPDFWHASWQIFNSIGGYVAIWSLMYLSLSVSPIVTIVLTLPAAGLQLRVFIIFHDCVHGSFYKSRRANDFWGFLSGILTFTPYQYWRWSHLVHHATSGNLEKRGVGDIWMMTVKEYLEAPRSKQLYYQFYRHPLFLFVFAPVFHFLIFQRIPTGKPKTRERNSVWIMNLALIGLVAAMIAICGFLPWMLIQFPIFVVSSSVGIWLFYVQHQYEKAYWRHKKEWNYVEAALHGSSFYKLPRVLQWFTGNIGFHHIHHLSPRIPNYNLARCHYSNPAFSQVRTLTLFTSFRLARLILWDEERQELISISKLKSQRLHMQTHSLSDASQ